MDWELAKRYEGLSTYGDRGTQRRRCRDFSALRGEKGSVCIREPQKIGLRIYMFAQRHSSVNESTQKCSRDSVSGGDGRTKFTYLV